MTDFWDELDQHWTDEAKKEAEEEASRSGDYDALPEGNYNVKVKDWVIKRSKNKGTPGLNMEFVVVDGQYKNRRIWHDFWLTKKNLPFVGRDLNYLTGQMFTQFSELKTYDFKGLYVTVKVKHEEYDGKTQVRVSYFSALSSNGTKSEATSNATESHDDIPF